MCDEHQFRQTIKLTKIKKKLYKNKKNNKKTI